MLKRSLVSLAAVSTSHGVGEKRVLLSNEETTTDITQIAETCLKKGEKVQMHVHPTMEEYFLFMKGEAVVSIEDETHICRTGDFLKIEAGVSHSLSALTDVKVVTVGCRLQEN